MTILLNMVDKVIIIVSYIIHAGHGKNDGAGEQYRAAQVYVCCNILFLPLRLASYRA
jgi:hypothetical protein